MILLLVLLADARAEAPPPPLAAIDAGEIAMGCAALREAGAGSAWERVGVAWCAALQVSGFEDTRALVARGGTLQEHALLAGLLTRYAGVARGDARPGHAIADLGRAAAGGDAFATAALASELEDGGDIWGARVVRAGGPAEAVDAPLRWADAHLAELRAARTALGITDLARDRYAADLGTPAPLQLPSPPPTREDIGRGMALIVGMAGTKQSVQRLKARAAPRPDVLAWVGGTVVGVCSRRDDCTPLDAALAWLDGAELLDRPDAVPMAAAAVLEVAGRADPASVVERAGAWARVATARGNPDAALALDFVGARARFDAGDVKGGLQAYGAVATRLDAQPSRYPCAVVLAHAAVALQRVREHDTASKVLPTATECMRAANAESSEEQVYTGPQQALWATWLTFTQRRVQVLSSEAAP